VGRRNESVDPGDVDSVTVLLGRRPSAAFEVSVRDDHGAPVVIRNAPVTDDGTPMPTLYYLVDPALVRRIGTLEASGGVKRAEAEVGLGAITATHDRYAAERDADLPEDWIGPRPAGGVGGTRRGLKCLHAHYAYHLAGGDDPVGRWVDAYLSDPGGDM
jgi:hypothetical protein